MGVDSDALIIRKSRRKSALLMLGYLIFVGVGVGWIMDPGVVGNYPATWLRVLGWVGVIIGGYGAAAGIIFIVRPARLILDRDGVVIEHWLMARRIKWTSIAKVFVWGGPKDGQAAWLLYDEAPERTVLSWGNRLVGADGTVGGGWTLAGPQIAAEMERRRTLFGRVGG